MAEKDLTLCAFLSKPKRMSICQFRIYFAAISFPHNSVFCQATASRTSFYWYRPGNTCVFVWRKGSFPPQQCNLMPVSICGRFPLAFGYSFCQIIMATKICFHFGAICHGFVSYPWWLFDILQLIIVKHAQKFSAHTVTYRTFIRARSL